MLYSHSMAALPRRHYATLLATYLRPQWPLVLVLAIFLLGSIGLQLAGPQLLRQFIDHAGSDAPLAALAATARFYLGVVIAGQVVALITTYWSETVGWNATNRLREDLALHCLRLPLSFHGAHTPGELIERVDGDVGALTYFFSQFVIRILGNGFLLAGVIALVWWEDWRIGLLMALFAVFALGVLRRMKRVAVPAYKAHRQGFADLTGFWEERLTGTEDLRALGAIDYTLRRHYAVMETHMRNARKGNVMPRVMQSTAEMLLALGTAAALTLGAYVVRGGAISLGTLYLVLAY